MQISTRTEDFVVDTLKLRVQVGPYLREVFKDPTKKKVGPFNMLSRSFVINLIFSPQIMLTFTLLGDAWSRSRYCVASTGLWHIFVQYV